MAIITTAEYNAYAGISGQDAQVAVLIAGAQKVIENLCGVDSWDSATYTGEKNDGSGTDTLSLRNRPITAVASVAIRSGLADATPETLDTNTYLFTTDKTGMLQRLSSSPFLDSVAFGSMGGLAMPIGPLWPVGRQNIVTTYTAGYATAPADLKEAMYRLVDSLRARVARDAALQSESMGAVSYTLFNAAAQPSTWWMSAVTPEVAAILMDYMRGSP